MNSKNSLLQSLAEALEKGVVTKNEVQRVLNASKQPTTTKEASSRLSAVDIMFYIAGIILFAGLAVLIGQSWDSGPSVRILLSTGTGVAFWAYAYLLIKAKRQDDIRRGLVSALLLCGSLLLIAGSFIIANEIISFETFHFLVSAVVLLLIGGIHIGFGLQIRRKLTLLTGILLAVAAFPSMAFGLLQDSGASVPPYVYALIVASSGALLAYAARTVAKISTHHKDIARSFDLLGTFTVLMSLYVASFDSSMGALWLLVLITAIIGLFYLSIVMQDKFMLGNGSFFLVLSIVTISFRYFSGYGAAASLLISAAGLLTTAVVATTINRRYLSAV